MLLPHATGCDRWNPDAYSGSDKSAFVIKGDHILVYRNVCFAECLLRLLTADVLVAQVDQQQMIVRAPGDNVVSFFDKGSRHACSVCNDLFRIPGKFIGKYLAKSDRF